MFKYGEKAEIVGDLDIQSFGMKVGAKGFNILISRIYSHKIRAAIREPLCNAYDAHSMNNNTTDKVQITLPNIIDPHLRIRDFGPGLRPDQMGMYVTLFESSKENSEEGTGFYGLGSKAPFCYTNSFNITTFVDGIKRQYSAFLDGQDAPKIAMLISEPTTEKNGVEVAIPVEQADFKEFETECCSLLAAFNDKPLLLNSQCTIPDIHAAYKKHFYDSVKFKEVHLEHADLCSALNERYGRSAKLYVNCANIIYQIDLDSNRQIYHAYRQLNWVSRSNIVLKCKKSDVSVPPSREHLEYTEETVANIISMLSLVNDELTQYCSTEIAALPSIIDRLNAANEYNSIGIEIDPNVIISKVFGTNTIASYQIYANGTCGFNSTQLTSSLYNKLRNAAVDVQHVFIQDTQTGLKTIETITAEKSKSDNCVVRNTVIQLRSEKDALCYSKEKFADLLNELKDTIRDLADSDDKTKKVKVMFTSELDRSVRKAMKTSTIYQYSTETRKFNTVRNVVDFSTVPKSTFVMTYSTQGFGGSISEFTQMVDSLIAAKLIDEDTLIYGTLKKNAEALAKKHKLRNHQDFYNIKMTDDLAFDVFKHCRRTIYYSYSGRLDFDNFKFSNAQTILGTEHIITKLAAAPAEVPSVYKTQALTKRITEYQTEHIKPYMELLSIVDVNGSDRWDKFATLIKLIDSTGENKND
jgi:hypothetical protein